jgi:ATP-dependent Clp endopeptidase proteolytic subunit ClpP
MQATVFIYEEVKTGLLARIASQLQREGNYESVLVRINSPGGDVSEGFAVYDFLNTLGKPVYTQIDGLCASIATVIALAGEERKIMPHSEFMIHNPWGMEMGDADRFESYAEQLRNAEAKIASLYASKTGKTAEEMLAMMKEERWMSADEAIELGFCTEKIEVAKMAAFARLNLNQTIMNEDVKKELTGLNGLLNDIKNLLSPKASAKAMVTLTAVDSEGNEKPIYVDSEDGELEGKSVYMDESMTEKAPAGDHKLTDNRFITVNEEGVITSVREDEPAAESKEDEEMEALKAENTSLKAEIEALKAVKAEMQTMATELNSLKALIQKPANQAPQTTPKVANKAEKKGVEFPILNLNLKN